MTIEYKDSKRIVANEEDVAVVSNRGTIDTTSSAGNTIITFTGDGTFTPTSAFNVETIVVAGGGGGGSGGGGAGGIVYDAVKAVTAKNYNITVGAGGTAGWDAGNGGQGEDSVFDNITSLGGGAGMRDNTNGSAGGSGAGGSATSINVGAGGASTQTASGGDTGYGNAGGSSSNSSPYPSSGGGGAGANGGGGTGSVCGSGGIGIVNPISGSTTGESSGGSYYLGGGGAGGRSGCTQGSGGTGGGGNGSGSTTGEAGTANTGGGGGGSYGSSGTGVGGSGVVIIKFATSGNTYSTSAGGKPTNVQDNSLLVEKDTARRYWFDAESERTPTFEDDFSSDNWTDVGTQIGVSGGKMVWNALRSGSNQGSYYDIGTANISETEWVLDFTLDIDVMTEGDTNAYFTIGLSDTSTMNVNTSQDFIGLLTFLATSSNNNSRFMATGANGGTTISGTDFTTSDPQTLGLFYVRIRRTSATECKVAIYSNSDYSTLVEEQTVTITSGLTGLRYLKLTNLTVSGAGTGVFNGTMDNVKYYNSTTSTTTPATWTMQPTFQDDFSTDRWVDMDSSKIGVNTTLERLDFDIKRDGSNDGSALDLGRTLSDTKWRVDYDLSLTTLTESGNSVILHVGLSDEDQTSDSANSQDAYTLRIDVWSAGQVTKLTDSEAQTLEGTTLHTFTDLTTTDYYISMIRNSATQCQLIIYSDSARTTVVEDSGIKTTTSGINGLRYFKVTNGGGSSGTGAIIGNIKNLKIYNGVTSIN